MPLYVSLPDVYRSLVFPDVLDAADISSLAVYLRHTAELFVIEATLECEQLSHY